jgi:hypothetical protein
VTRKDSAEVECPPRSHGFAEVMRSGASLATLVPGICSE